MSKTSSATTADNIWGHPRRTMTADTDLELVLVDNARIPFTIPASQAETLAFKGEVWASDIQTRQPAGAL
jgi:hypothetical protein